MPNSSSYKDQYSFINLIDYFKIQIPILQRDYVQGRKNEIVKDIRENFVSDLVEHISVETEKILPLDFIYGYADEEFGKFDREISRKNIDSLLTTIRNYSSSEDFEVLFSISDRKNISKNLFIPLDGQQRLTTLFLLHFYVALKHRPEQLLILREKLTYKTRKSSDQFCEKLLLNATKLDTEMPIAVSIQDSNWFLISWKKDPTVDGMLIMLDEIERKFNTYPNLQKRLEIAFDNLFKSPKVVFDFLDMNEKGLSNDIYLKMNSTGKPLSDYDNFKSWFVSRVETLVKNNVELTNTGCFKNWKEKLDQEWYNIFWLEDPIHSDKLIYKFIKSVFAFSILAADEEESIVKEKFDKLNSDSFLSLKFFEDNNLITLPNVQFLFCLFNELCRDESDKLNTVSEIWSNTFSDGKRFKKAVVTELSDLSLIHKTFFYAVFCLLSQKEDLSQVTFRKWVRTFRNLIYNTRIDDFSRFISPINTLKLFISHISARRIENEKWIDFFDGKQVKEEFEKLGFENDLTIDEFELAENHHYLYGQIYFLLNWAQNRGNLFDFDLFKRYRIRFFNFFSIDHLNSEAFILQRVLLSKDDSWMPDKGSNRFSFCKNTYNTARERDENWRILFNKPDSEILDLLKSDCEPENLLNIIKNGRNNITDWRKYVIEDPSLISKCGQRLINWVNNGNFIRLLDKTKLSGFHTELRTWVLFKKLREKFDLSDEDLIYQYADSGERDCRIKFIDSETYIKFDRSTNSLCYESYMDVLDKFQKIESPSKLESKYIEYVNNFNLQLND
ncbi:MAG TPA: DUF262 domain-containing protein [Sphingobacteriaceae bacterium]